MTDGSGIEYEHDHGPDLNCQACYYGELSQWRERSVDEIYEAIQEALSDLNAARLSAVAQMTGISIEKLIELGGVYEDPGPQEK